jgi:hypothetical protein
MGVRSVARAQPAPGGGARRARRWAADGVRGACERASRPFALFVTSGLLALAALAALALLVLQAPPLAVLACATAAVAGGAAARAVPPGTAAWPLVLRRWRRESHDRTVIVIVGLLALAAPAIPASQLLHIPARVLMVIAAGALAGVVAAFTVPLKAPSAATQVTVPRKTPSTAKRVTLPLAPRERDPFAGRYWLTAAVLLGIVAVAAVVRLWHFNTVGYNSDEAVYAGQGAGIAHDSQLAPYFPVFRAHPLLFQSVIAIGYELHQGDWFARAAAIAFGALCVVATFELGRLLYGVRVGLIAASVLALMPYHVIVSRQVLLDGPQAFFTTVTLCALIRFARSGRTVWLCCTGAAMGLSVLAKEPSVIFCGAVYAFFALSPEVRVRMRAALLSLAIMAITIAPYPLALLLSGQTGTGGNFLAWQLVRRPNHSLDFYLIEVPSSIGFAVCALAALSLLARARGRRWTWRETLVACWIGVPLAFLELWPVKGFQYLLPLAPVIAVLAAEGLSTVARAFAHTQQIATRWVRPALVLALLATLAVPTFSAVAPASKASFLAGSGGVPGGRETGRFIRANVPQDATMLAIGPSMANILEFYGRRRAYGLSVSTNPLRRNPIYQAVTNPDLSLRRGDIQYIVWDAFSASRSRHFERRLLSYVSRYHGRAVYTFSVLARTPDGSRGRVPVIRVYAVQPS